MFYICVIQFDMFYGIVQVLSGNAFLFTLSLLLNVVNVRRVFIALASPNPNLTIKTRRYRYMVEWPLKEYLETFH